MVSVESGNIIGYFGTKTISIKAKLPVRRGIFLDLYHVLG